MSISFERSRMLKAAIISTRVSILINPTCELCIDSFYQHWEGEEQTCSDKVSGSMALHGGGNAIKESKEFCLFSTGMSSPIY